MLSRKKSTGVLNVAHNIRALQVRQSANLIKAKQKSTKATSPPPLAVGKNRSKSRLLINEISGK
jgi:hypothetical protein